MRYKFKFEWRNLQTSSSPIIVRSVLLLSGTIISVLYRMLIQVTYIINFLNIKQNGECIK